VMYLTNTYTAEYVSDVPEAPARGVVYIVGEGSRRWCVALMCPCGCGDMIQCSTMEGIRPRWTVTVSGISPTITPSINRTAGCRSHFCITDGKVT
jgi:hypothetical protein